MADRWHDDTADREVAPEPSAIPVLAEGPNCYVPQLVGEPETGGDGAYRILGHVTVGLDPEGVQVDPVSGLTYVACSRSNAVAVVDLDQMAVIDTIAVGLEPIDVAVDPRTGRIFTADARSDQLSVIDGATRTVIATVPVGTYPAGLDIDVEGRRLYCGDTMSSTVSVVDLDRLERIAAVEAELGAGAVVAGVRQNRVYCANFIGSSVTVVQTPDLKVVDRLTVGEGPCAVAVNPVLDELYVVNCLTSTVARIDTATGDTLAELPTSNAPVGMVVSPLGDRIYVTNRGDGSVSVLGLDGVEWARIPVGAAPGGVSVHPDNPRLLLVANAGTGTLTVAEDLLDGPPAQRLGVTANPLVGQKIPAFSLPDLHTGELRHSAEWAGKKYILNVFASW